jgi:hypothetical protein
MAVLTSMYGMFSRHESATGWRTDRSDVVLVQNDTAICQGIDVWCWNLVGSVKSNIIPTLNTQMEGINIKQTNKYKQTNKLTNWLII